MLREISYCNLIGFIYNSKIMDKEKNVKAMLLGLGLDCKDGHIRVSEGKNFHLFGGSEDTHNLMFEKVIKLNQQLDKKGKSLESVSEDEFFDIANKVGLKITDPHRN